MNRTTLNAALGALPAIYDVSSPEGEWETTLDTIVDVCGAKGAMIFGIDETGLDFSLLRSSSFWASMTGEVEEFFARYGRYDAAVRRHMFRNPALAPFDDYAVWPNEDLYNREDMRFAREKVGVFLRSAVNLSPAHGWKAGMTMHHAPDRTEVDPEVTATLAILAPHLSKSLELRRFVSGLQQRYRMVLAVLDRVHLGLCVAEPNGEIVISNAVARRVFAGGRGLSLGRDKKLIVSNPELGLELCQAIRDAARLSEIGYARARTKSFHLKARGSDDTLYMEVSPMNDGAGEFAKNFRGALITLIDLAEPPNLSARPLASLCALSDAETAITDLLLQGKRVEDIAEMRNRSVLTVRTQVRNIFAKCQVASLAELARKAAYLSPPIL